MWRSASETLSSTIFDNRFPPFILTVVSQFNVILTINCLSLWLEYRFKSFLELHVHFKCFVCTHAQPACRMPDSRWWQIVFSLNDPKYIPKYSTTKTLSQFLGWSVRTLAQYISMHMQNFIEIHVVFEKNYLFILKIEKKCILEMNQGP